LPSTTIFELDVPPTCPPPPIASCAAVALSPHGAGRSS
jgi:hypothetical protein